MRRVYNLFGIALWTFNIIGLDVEDGDDAGVTVGGGEEDPRPLEMAPWVLLRCDGRFRRWSSSAKVYGDEAEAGQDRQRKSEVGA